MITVYPEEKGLFTFYFEEQNNSEAKQQLTNQQPHHFSNKKTKKKKYKFHGQKEKSKNFKTQPSDQSGMVQQETSIKDIFLSKIITKRQKILGRQLSPIDEKLSSIPLIKSRRGNITEIVKEKNKSTENNNLPQEEFIFEGNCRNLRSHFYNKAKTQGRQQIQEPLSNVDFKLPLIKSTKLTKAFDNLIGEEGVKKTDSKPVLSKSSNSKKSQKKLLKGILKKQKSLQPIVKQGQHLAVFELSCVQHNNYEWPERKKKLLKKLGRKI